MKKVRANKEETISGTKKRPGVLMAASEAEWRRREVKRELREQTNEERKNERKWVTKEERSESEYWRSIREDRTNIKEDMQHDVCQHKEYPQLHQKHSKVIFSCCKNKF